MKNILILLFILLAVFGFADEYKFPPETTLYDISTKTSIPVKKICQYLDQADVCNYNITIKELGISNEDVQKAIAEYHSKTSSFYTGIIFVGMGIVFISLIIIGFIISSLQHFVKTKKKVKVPASVSSVKAPKEHISSNGIVAAITAMYLHDAEEQDKINLTWKRQTFSRWYTAGMVENKVFENRRGKI